MSVHAGSILHVGGNNVIDRIQSAGLGDVRLPIETIREVGNREVVDKVPGEPDFTFTMESLNTSTELMAWLTGAWGAGSASAQAPGASDPDGTEYDWLDALGCKNIASPWKDPATGSAGVVEAGHLIPGYYPTRLRYRFGVTDNATQEVELAGGSFFYGEFAPLEERWTGTGVQTAFITTEDTVHYRRGGADGTLFKDVFGVMVDGILMVEDVDYTVSGGDGSPATITFDVAPDNNADIRAAYFTDAAKAYPQSVHASSVVIPGAVRGRNIHVYVNGQKIGGIQTAELEATVDGQVDRELGTEEATSRTINGTDANGTLTIRARDKDAFFDVLSEVTGVDRSEIFGWFNEEVVDLEIGIENPKAPGTLLKTLVIDDAKFQPPGTPARVNAATDFAVQFSSNRGTFRERKGGNVVDLATP
jgi:hypothetical protein